MVAGATLIKTDIPVIVDPVSELAEIFEITFNISSSLSGIFLSKNTSVAICIIIDNTSKLSMVKYIKLHILIILLDATVSFVHSVYIADESDKLVQIGLNFSNPLSFNTTIIVLTMNGSAIG